MYKIIVANYNHKNVNFLWAHNSHVADLPYSLDNLLYIKKNSIRIFLILLYFYL